MFWLGCAVWSYKDWVGEFFPPGSRPNEFLQLYGDRFNAVEGNTTFYATPTVETLLTWAGQVPAGFAFCPKLPREVTHAGTLVPQLAIASPFAARMEHLGDRLGPMFAQLPPSYGPEQRADLEQFLSDCPRGAGLSLEVRHPEWFADPHATRLNELLARRGIGRVLLDTRPVYRAPEDTQQEPRRKPDLPLQPLLTADFAFVRYISHPEFARNDPYLEEWSDRVADWLAAGTRVYFFVHCPQEVYSPAIARRFYRQLAARTTARQIELPPLPWDAISPEPEQLDLFES